MLIKVKFTPDNEMTGDLGTCYILTNHQDFIKTLESITDYKVMPHFLDANKHYYTELVKTPAHYDKEIDVSGQCLKNIQDDSMLFKDKQISDYSDIPKMSYSTYDNDCKTGTDYEYNHALDEYIYQKPKIVIKVKFAPDTEITGDAGTSYIVTEHKGFIETLESITDYKVMPCFLDANKQYYTELVKTPSHFDKEIDVTTSFMSAIEDDEMDFMDKVIDKRLCDIPKIQDL